ncbi:MAG: hypothetical protein WC364_14825 [Eubacteriales bacterium]|jgi:hypothetical protein
MLVQIVQKSDIEAVRTAVSVFLQSDNPAARDVMLGACRAVLDRYGVKRIRFPEYIVEATSPGLCRIRALNSIDGRACPICGADIYVIPGDVRILSYEEGFKSDRVHMGCSCGQIFFKDEVKEGYREGAYAGG